MRLVYIYNNNLPYKRKEQDMKISYSCMYLFEHVPYISTGTREK